MEILKLINFVNIYKYFIYNTCQHLNFCRKLLKCIKERENRNDILNSQVLLVTNHVRTSFNVKSCNIQQPIRYFKLLANCYINSPQTDFWEKFNNVPQLQNEHMWSGTPAKVLTYVTHMENSQKKLNSDLPVLKFVL